MRKRLLQIILTTCLVLFALTTVYAQATTDTVLHAKRYNDLGVGQIDAGDYATAIDLFNKAIQLRPQDAVAHFNLGSAYYLSGEYNQALVHLQRAIDIYPQYASGYNQMGVVYSDIGEQGSDLVLFWFPVD